MSDETLCRKCGRPVGDPAFGSPETGWEHVGGCPSDPFDMHECEIHGVHRGPTCRRCSARREAFDG